MHGILLSTLGWCFQLLLGIVTKTNMQDCSSFPCCLSWTLLHRRNVASLSFFNLVITLANVHLNWLNWFHFLILEEGGLLVILIDCMIFLLPFMDVARMSMSTVNRILCLIECFRLTYDLSGLKFRINRHSLSVGFFWTDFLYALFFLFFSCNSIPYSDVSTLHGVNPNYIKYIYVYTCVCIQWTVQIHEDTSFPWLKRKTFMKNYILPQLFLV